MSARAPVVLREADREDAAGLIALWAECVGTDPDESVDPLTQQSLWREPEVPEAAAAIEVNLGHPDKRIFVALIAGEIIGATVCDIRTLTPITLTKVLSVTDLQVSPRFRRRSVASSLLAAVADYGDEKGCDIVVASLATTAREQHRFLAKLGFSQVAVVRAISASKLQSRLSGKAVKSRDTGKMIAVRRTLRRRQRTS